MLVWWRRYCAFGDYDKEMGEGEHLVQNRMPYVQWLVEHVTAQLTPDEVAMRSQPDKAPSIVEAARRDAEEWARQVGAFVILIWSRVFDRWFHCWV